MVNVVARDIASETREAPPARGGDGWVAGFLEAGDRATLFAFDYEHPPEPPSPCWVCQAGDAPLDRARRRPTGPAGAPVERCEENSR